MGHYRKNLITLFLNDYCNMSCIYCPMHSKTAIEYKMHDKSKVLDIEFAKCGIRDFFEQTKSYKIRLFANGEPTLSFSLMKDIVEYSKKLAGEKLYVELQSNGFFSDEVCKWVDLNVDMLWISLDGIQEVQDKQRLSTTGETVFPVIDRNIKALKSSRKTKLGLRPTITEYGMHRQKELINYCSNNNITIIYAYPWVSFMRQIEGQPSLEEFAQEYLQLINYAKERNVYYGTIFMINFDEEVEINCRALLPAPHLTPDGYVSCCDMMNNGEGILEDLIYGKYIQEENRIEYDPQKIEKIQSRNIYNLPQCKNCEVLKHCAGGCVGSAILYSGSFYGINQMFCKTTKFLYKHMQEFINVGYNTALPLHP